VPSQTSSRPAVFDRLYEEKSLTQRYDNSKVLGVKEILQNAQNSLNRSNGRPSFDGVNILLTEDTDRKYSVPLQVQRQNNEKILDHKYSRTKNTSPVLTSGQRSPQSNNSATKNKNYNFSFGGDSRNYSRHTQQNLAKINYANDQATGSQGRVTPASRREFPPDPAELIYSSPKSQGKPAHQTKYFENKRSSGNNVNTAFSYVSGTAESQYYRQPVIRK
jgi:hypothetical protein